MSSDRNLLDQIKASSGAIFEHYFERPMNRKENTVRCPFHGEDNRPSMSINPFKGVFRCLSCGAAGDVIAFVQRLEGCTFPVALELCCDLAGLDRNRGKAFDPEVKRRAEQRQEEAELLTALRAWHGRTAMHKAALAHSLESQLSAQVERLSLVTAEQREARKPFVDILEAHLEYLKAEFKRTVEEHSDYLGAGNDMERMALLFVREYDLKLVATTVRTMNDAIKAIWDASFDDEIDPGKAPRLEQLLALAILRQIDNKTLLDKLGRGWYTDVLIPKPAKCDDGDGHGQLFDARPEDSPLDGGSGALEGPRVGDRALAETAREAVERAERVRSEVKAAMRKEAERICG